MLLVSKYTAIKQLIHEHLLTALSIYTRDKNSLFSQGIDIPLNKSRENCEVLYISGVALKLSKLLQCDVSSICGQIVSHFSVNCSDNYRVEVVFPGWIHIHVADAIACMCFQSIIDARGEQKNHIQPSSDLSPKLFAAQYAHARCCSLLRLAEHEGVKQPQSIDWLDINRISSTNSACRNLIGKLIEVVDQVVCSNHLVLNQLKDVGSREQGAGGENNPPGEQGELRHYEKSCLALSKAFESFWSQSPIWADTSPELLQAKLILVMATQSMLRYLLKEKLSIYAPLEL
jgi:DALR anticodon binding domain